MVEICQVFPPDALTRIDGTAFDSEYSGAVDDGVVVQEIDDRTAMVREGVR